MSPNLRYPPESQQLWGHTSGSQDEVWKQSTEIDRRAIYLKMVEEIDEGYHFYMCIRLRIDDPRCLPELWYYRPRYNPRINSVDDEPRGKGQFAFAWYPDDEKGMQRRRDRLMEAYLLTFMPTPAL